MIIEDKERANQCPLCTTKAIEFFPIKFGNAAKCGNSQCGHIYKIETALSQGVQSGKDPDFFYNKYKKNNVNLIKFLVKRNFLSNGARILDVGAGSGHFMRSISEQLPDTKISCLEPDPYALRNLEKFGHIVASDFSQLTGKFDAIFLLEVIEHVDDPVELLMNCKRFLSHNARVFMTTPCGEFLNGNRNTPAYNTPDHVQFFTEKSLKYCVKKAGYKPLHLETINQISSAGTPAPMRYFKNFLRPLHSRLFGYRHLTGFIEV